MTRTPVVAANQTLSPESLIIKQLWQVFWLVRFFEAFPSRKLETVAKDFQKHLFGLTAAGTAPDFNGIPF
jgi:hypothetical protein